MRPGTTDSAAILYRDEEKFLAGVPLSWEALPREQILPRKQDLYAEYEGIMESAARTGELLQRIPFSHVVCDGNELAYVREILESGWLTTASKAQAFERRFAEMVGARFSIAVNFCINTITLGERRR